MENLIAKAATLLEALPYVQKFSGATFVIKYGGSFMDSPDANVRNGVARDIVFLEAVEINPVVVHGGGKAITRAMEKAVAPYARFETVEMLTGADFQIECEEKYDVAPDLKDLFLYCGKNRPERYLDPHIRSGISTFADAPDADEIDRGLKRLADDIESGRINRVIRSFAHDGGDYMFTVARK